MAATSRTQVPHTTVLHTNACTVGAGVKKAAIVVWATFTPAGNAGTTYAGIVFNRIGEIVAPDSPPNVPVCPRADC
jgi:hypothetical protein